MRKALVISAMFVTLAASGARASERYFTYTCEPETMPAGAAEFEQWVTWRGLRNNTVGQNTYSKWEVRDHNELPDYTCWENTAVFLGPVVTYTRENWWTTLTVMPQIYGKNFQGDADGESGLELEGHERVNARLIFGIGF